jgi:hypothetical protein
VAGENRDASEQNSVAAGRSPHTARPLSKMINGGSVVLWSSTATTRAVASPRAVVSLTFSLLMN